MSLGPFGANDVTETYHKNTYFNLSDHKVSRMASHNPARPVSSVYEKQLRRNRLRKILIETLERRELLASDLAFTAFADGTDDAYIQQFKQTGGVDPTTATGRWTNNEVTWSIVPDGTIDSATGDPSNLIAFMDAVYGRGDNGALQDRPWFPLFQSAYESWSNVSGINFTYEAADDGAPIDQTSIGDAGVRGDIRIGGRDIDGNFNSLALNYAPSDGGASGLDGDMIIDTNDAWFVVNAEDASAENRFLANLIAQQAGHGLGLGHRIDAVGEKLMEHTVTDVFAGPQHDDILGAQRIYGDSDEGNNNPGSATQLGNLGNGSVRIAGNSIDSNADTDWYGFRIPSNGKMTLALSPTGEIYDAGDDGGAVLSLNTQRNMLLGFRVIDGATMTTLISGTAASLGDSVSITDFSLPRTGPDGYLIEVTGAGADIQQYNLDITLSDISTDLQVGPTLLSVSPNVGEIFSFNGINQLTEGPNELTLRFDRELSDAALAGFQIYRSGKDLEFDNGNDVVITPGWIGFGETRRIIKARFASPLVDDLYRIEVLQAGITDTDGNALIPRVDGTDRDAVLFRLELGALVNAVVPQPVTSQPDGTVTQARDQIVVYFNNDDLHPEAVTSTGSPSDPTVVRPEFYQLILTEDSVTPGDDTVFRPNMISYDPATDSATLTFANDIDQLAGGAGTFRLRVGSNIPVNSAANPPVIPRFSLGGDVPGFTAGAVPLGGPDFIVAQELVNTQNQLNLAYPGSAFSDPGHRDVNGTSHTVGAPDVDLQVTQQFYNFALDRDYLPGDRTSITPEQMDRVREIFEYWGAQLGIDFVETSEKSDFTVVVGPLSGAGGSLGTMIVPDPIFAPQERLVILDAAEAWTTEASLNPSSSGVPFFGEAFQRIGQMLGLGQIQDLPDGTIMARRGAATTNNEDVYPGDHDVVHGQMLFRPDNKDVDLYRFDVPVGVSGQISIETMAERLSDSSNADTHITLFRETSSGLEVVASNDNYFSSDSYIKMDVTTGTYLIGVTASGNEDFNPVIDNTGSGGTSEGPYELRVNFDPQVSSTIVDINGSALDGDGDGLAGGEFNFWFRAAAPADVAPSGPKTVYVNKDFTGASTGESMAPFSSIPEAIVNRSSGDIIRIAATMGADDDASTVADNPAYEIGRGGLGNGMLSDGISLEIPQGITAMIDAGAIFKMGGSRVVVGSRDAGTDNSFAGLQVLGTPGNPVIFTSIDDESIGIDTNPIPTQPQAGQWGGIEFRNDVDREQGRGDFERQGIFLNYVGYADMRFGGGQVLATFPSPTVSPLQMSEARPTLLNNSISQSADSAMSADPDSFEETIFTEPRYQLADTFNSDYNRIGPDIRGTMLEDNSINGLFIRVETLAGNEIDQLDVQARFDDTDIPHVLGQNLLIRGTPGGAVHDAARPDVSLVNFNDKSGSLVPGETHSYIVSWVDRFGGESLPSVATTIQTVGSTGGVQLNSLPRATGDFVGRYLYRSANGGVGPFTLVAELDSDSTSFVDAGQDLGSEHPDPTIASIHRARPDARLAIDPGILIKATSSRIEVGISGQLIAEGTDGKPIIFTSRFDDRYGAAGVFDTNNDGATTSSNPGDWSGIVARHESSLSLDHTLVTFAGGISSLPGGFAGFNALELHQADARVANSTFENNANGLGGNLGAGTRVGRGTHDESVIFVRGSQPVIIDNVIRDNTDGAAAISIDANSLKSFSVQDGGRETGASDRLPGAIGNVGPLVRGNLLAGNSLNGINIRGGATELTTETVWDDTDMVHILQEDIVVGNFHTFGGLRLQSRPGESLVVKSGNGAAITATGTALDIPDRIGGAVRILGVPGFPVIMTSLADDTVGAGFGPDGDVQTDTNGNGASTGAPGQWQGIVLESLSNDRNVNTILELEPDEVQGSGSNNGPLQAQLLGQLADDLDAGDENLRLGFTVQGNIATESDLDVYKFVGNAGSTVWIDIDRTGAALDSVVEVLDIFGRVLAQSDNSIAESQAGNVLFTDPGVLPGTVHVMDQDPFAATDGLSGVDVDFQTTNPADAGLRIELPGASGTPNDYYIRVRSSNVGPTQSRTRLQDPALTSEGLTTGTYRLNVRLQQQDEIGGSTVRYADIRFASTGIDVNGLPRHSNLLGTSSDLGAVPGNDWVARALNVGNIGQSDRASISLAGDLTADVDVDWYRFDVEGVRGAFTPAITLDVDYADGFGRPDTSLWVYELVANDELKLTYIGTDSDVSDDQARSEQGLDVGDFSRGSAGTNDPFIGSRNFAPGTYLVAVTSGSRQADNLLQYTARTSTRPHFSTDFRLVPISPRLFSVSDPDVLDIGGLSPVPFNLADLTAFTLTTRPSVSGPVSNLVFTNPFTGVTEAEVGDDFPDAVKDFALRTDPTTDSYLVGFGQGINDEEAGEFYRFDSAGDGAVASGLVGNAGMITFSTTQTTDANGNTTFAVRQQETEPGSEEFNGIGVQIEGLTFQNDGSNLFGVGFRDEFFSAVFGDPANPDTITGRTPEESGNYVYRFNPDTGAVIGNAGETRTTVQTQTQGAGTNAVEYFELDSTGLVTGLTSIDGDEVGQLFAVSDQGEFYRMAMRSDGSQTFTGLPETIPSLRTLTDGGTAIPFTGLGVGPSNLANNILFGVTADGTIYAFDTFGNFQNIFPNGDFKVRSQALGASNVHDMEFSPLDQNLWHATDNNADDGGDGFGGTVSLRFGFEDPRVEPDPRFRQPGTWSDRVIDDRAGNLMFPGGAEGALESDLIDLSAYSASDEPHLYFSYNADRTDVSLGEVNVLDALRVYAADDTGEWTQLASNNANEAGPELFDSAEWRQARISLADFAGKPDIRLRFEFTTGGFRAGLANFDGEELTAIPGASFNVGDPAARRFTVASVDQANAQSADFEFDFGLVLNLPAGASIEDGDTITVDGTPMVFQQTFPPAANQVFYSPNMPPALVAASLRASLQVSGFTVVTNPELPNMLNVTNANANASVAGLPGSVIVDQPGVAPGRTAIDITQADSAQDVLAAVRAALANAFNVAGQQGNLNVWPTYGDTVKLYKYTVTLGNADPTETLRLVNAANRGDRFSNDGNPPNEPAVQVTQQRRAQRNNFPGVYIDNIIIGLAERGEFAEGAASVGPNQAANDNDVFSGEGQLGRYQLEIRTSSSSVLDSNSRYAPGLGFEVTGASGIADGQTFELTDGVDAVTFEFNVVPDRTNPAGDPAGDVTPGNVSILLQPDDTAEDIAKEIVAAVNSPTVQSLLAVSAHVQSNSRNVEFHGPASFSLDGSSFTGVPALDLGVNFLDNDQAPWGRNLPGEDHGDSNRYRDQGVVLIESTFVSNSQNWGIDVDADARAPESPTSPGSPIHYPTDNPDNLAPGVVLLNNVLDSNTVGGILISGVELNDLSNAGRDIKRPSPVARVVNNTIFGDGSGTGIRVNDDAAPYILNNILAENGVGIEVIGSLSQLRTTVGANFYFGNTTNTAGVTNEAFAGVSTTSPFLDAATGNFYLRPGSNAIDSSIDELAEAASLAALKSAIGLPPSPALAPDSDVAGQRRVDDPNVSSPAGLGSNIFKDRGAYDRADFIGLQAILQEPVDNDSRGLDIESAPTVVQLSEGGLRFFEVLLVDPFGGSGPDNATVNAENVILTENGERLIPGADYVFGYNTSNRTIRFTPLSGLWRDDSVYEITLVNNDAFVLDLPADGRSIADGDTLAVTVGGTTHQFEWDTDETTTSGTAIPFKQDYSQSALTFALLKALKDVGIVAFVQGSSGIMVPGASVSGTPGGSVVTAIRDIAGNRLQPNRPTDLTQFTLFMPEVKFDYGDGPNPASVLLANDAARHSILPIDVANPKLGSFVDADMDGVSSNSSSADDLEVRVLPSSTIPGLSFGVEGQGVLTLPIPSAALDGQVVTIVSGLSTLDFEFDNDGSASGIPVDFSGATTADDVADSLRAAIESELFAGRLNDIAPTTNGAVLNIGAAPHVSVDVTAAPDVTQTIAGNIEVRFGSGVLADSQFMEILDGSGQTIRFELNDTSAPGEFRLPSETLALVNVDLTTATTEDVVQAIADEINVRVALGALGLGPAVANGTSLFINGDDEQGVTFGGLLNSLALPVPVTVTSTDTGVLDAWIDYSGDGLFTPDEQIADTMLLLPGANTFLVTVPNTAQAGFTTSRFRVSKTGNVLANGLALGGEVEDHLVEIVAGTPPVALDDSYRVNEDEPLSVTAPGILANDSDIDSLSFGIRDEDPLKPDVQPFEDVKRGNLVLRADGSFDYMPEPDFFGVDTFVYFVQDERLTSGTAATVTINVSPINDVPDPFDDEITIHEDQSVVVAGEFLTRNDFKGQHGTDSQFNELPQTLTIIEATISAPPRFAGQTVMVMNNELHFTPPAHYTSQTDGAVELRVTVTDDGQSFNDISGVIEDDFQYAVSTLTINIIELNDSPEFNMTSNLNHLEDADPQVVPGFISNIMPGPNPAIDEGAAVEDQSVAFTATALDPTLFASGPSIDANGVLSYEVAEHVNSNAPFPPQLLVEVAAVDSGAGDTILTNVFDPTEVASTSESYDGVKLTITDTNGNVVVFEFDDAALPGVGSTGGIPHAAIGYDATDTNATVSAKIAEAISNPPAASISAGTGPWVAKSFVDAVNGDIRVVSDASTVVTPADITITLTNLFTGLVGAQSYDGATFTLVDGNSNIITFELNDTTDAAPATPGVTAGHAAINYDPTFTKDQLSQAISDAINTPDPAITGGLPTPWIANSLLPPGSSTLQVTSVISLGLSNSTSTIVNPLETEVVTKSVPVDYRPAHDAPVQTFTITIEPVNDAPEFDMTTPLELLEDAGPQNFTDFVTGAVAGPGGALDESSQNLTLNVVAVDPSAFLVQPTVVFDSLTGTADLQFDLNPDVNNETGHDLRIVVSLMDDGGTANNGVDVSVQTLTLDVTPVNDRPSFDLAETELTYLEDNELVTGNAPTRYENFAVNATQGPGTAVDETTLPATKQTLLYQTISVSDPSLFSQLPAITPDGHLEFHTAPDANGTAVISVRLLDNGLGGTPNGDDNQARPDLTFTINLTAVNDAPTFDIPATISGIEDEGLVQRANFATNLLPGPGTATDEINQQFTVTAVAEDPSAFLVQPTISANGTLVYQTAPDVNREFANLRVRVTVSDDGPNSPPPNSNTSAEKTFTIDVAPINDAPFFVLETPEINILEDVGMHTESGVTSNAVAGPATAVDENDPITGQTLNYEVVAVSAPELFATQPALDANGQLTFETAEHKNGTALVVIRLVDSGVGTPPPNDNDSVLRTITINIAAVNDAPEFSIPGSTTVDEDAGLVSIGGFATDVRRGPVGTDDENSQQVAFTATATDPAAFATQPTISPDGTLVFQTAQDVNGPLEVVVQLSDSGLGAPPPNDNTSDSQTFTINVLPVNDEPITMPYVASTAEDKPITILAADVLQNDLPGPPDESAQSLIMTQIERTGSQGGIIVPVFNGSEIVSFTYTPPTDVVLTDTFLYVVTDNGTPARSGSGTISINITGVNDPPQFDKGPNQVVPEDAGAVSVSGWASNILAGPPVATDEHGTQTVTFDVTTNNPDLFAVAPAISSDGTLTYTSATDANGTAVVTVTPIDDGPSDAPNNNTGVAQSFTITVTPVNDAPVFTGSGDVQVAEDSGSYSEPWASDILPAGGLANNPATATDETPQGVDFVVTNDQPALFSVQPIISSSGQLQFAPSNDSFGTAIVTVTAVDQGPAGGQDVNNSAPQSFTITIEPVNDTPVAVPDEYTIDENSILSVAADGLLANDTDVDGDSLAAVPATITSNLSAEVTINADGSFQYDPTMVLSLQQMSDGQSVLDTFIYEVEDPSGSRSTTVVSITVTGIDDAPIANDDAFSLGVGQSRLLEILLNDTDVDSAIDPRSITITQLPITGTAVANQTGVIEYTAADGFVGVDTLGYTIRDAAGNLSNEAFVTVTMNNPPIAVDDSTFTFKNEPLNINILGNDSDSDGTLDPSSVQIVGQPTTGTVQVLADGTVTYTPATDFFGEDSFAYVVSDNLGTTSNVADVLIRVQRSRWQNPTGNLDVNDDGQVSPLDALLVINYLNSGAEPFLPTSGVVPPPFYDVNGDEFVTPIDAFRVISFLNENSGGGAGEGEAADFAWSEQYAMTVTPEQMIATVGKQVVEEVQQALHESMEQAMQADDLDTDLVYGPQLPPGFVSESDELLDTLTAGEASDEEMHQALDDLFGTHFCGPKDV
ncbi:MAG: Ig-like domain-containing protein [Planctomycetota bacterium]|nr:Ig-like domain-containing protein [Planctomycetota bacterium]